MLGILFKTTQYVRYALRKHCRHNTVPHEKFCFKLPRWFKQGGSKCNGSHSGFLNES